MSRLTSTVVRAFRKRIYDHYDKRGRSLLWWKIRDPYRVPATEIAVDLEAALELFTKIVARLGKGKR